MALIKAFFASGTQTGPGISGTQRISREAFVREKINELAKADKLPQLREIAARGETTGKFLSSKYGDARKYLSEFYTLALKLNLVNAPSMRVLDIGCGAGWLEYVFNSLGHRVYGIDIQDEILDEIANVLETSRHVEPVLSKTKMAVAGPFDLVVSKGAFFDRGDRNDFGYEWIWSLDDYAFFINDVRRKLEVNGRFYFRLNGAGDQNDALKLALWHRFVEKKTFLLERSDLDAVFESLVKANKRSNQI